jgi:hypothetical protein
MDEFKIKDCALVVMTDEVRPAINLRELYDRLGVCSHDVLYHHFCETHLRPTFDDPDYPNDFAAWSHRALNDKVLAERLSMINPYAYKKLDDLRSSILETIDERLSESTSLPRAVPGMEFYFLRALTVVFETGKEIEAPKDLPQALCQMSTSSIYHHFLEARRRTENSIDDFTLWLDEWNQFGQNLKSALNRIDYYLLTLPELKKELCKVAKSEA